MPQTARPSRSPLALLGLLFFLTVTSFGCASQPLPPLVVTVPVDNDPLGDPVSPYRDLDALEEGQIVHVASGREVSFDEMMAVVADAKVVYVGEMHTNLEDHRAQARVIEAMAKRHPGQVMVGLEMFDHHAQAALDAWVAGETSEAEFLHTWYRNWSQDYDYYREILEFARDNQIPLIGLNATRDEVRRVSKGESKAAEDTPAPQDETEPDPYHTAYMEAIFGGHSHGGDRYYKVQTLWEETMAQGVVDALLAAGNKNKHMVVLAGGGHIQYGFGIPRRVFLHTPLSYRTILPITVNLPEDRDDLRMNVEMPALPLPLADFAWSVPYRDLEGKQIRLGVMLDRQRMDEGLWVDSVMDASAAADAGVQGGDQLLSLDGTPITDLVDLKVILSGVEAGSYGTLVVLRLGAELVLNLPYRTAAEQKAPARKH